MEPPEFWKDLRQRFTALHRQAREFHIIRDDTPLDDLATQHGQRAVDLMHRPEVSIDEVYATARLAARAAFHVVEGLRVQFVSVGAPPEHRQLFYDWFRSCAIRGGRGADLVPAEATDELAYHGWLHRMWTRAVQHQHRGDPGIEGVIEAPCLLAEALCEEFENEALRLQALAQVTRATLPLGDSVSPAVERATAAIANTSTSQLVAEPGAAEPLTKVMAAAGTRGRLERRAAWLKNEMRKRDYMTPNRLHNLGGPDRKTIQRILAGQRVTDTVLDKLASALSFNGPTVKRDEIPND